MQSFYNQITNAQTAANQKPATNLSIEKLATMTTFSRDQVKAVVSAEPWNVWSE